MVHLVFLVISLVFVAFLQKVLVSALSRSAGEGRRWLVLVALTLPVSVLAFFGLTMLPAGHSLGMVQGTQDDIHTQWLIALGGLIAFSLPVAVAGVWNVLRLGLLYSQTLRRTWVATAPVAALLPQKGRSTTLRLWASPKPFAFNMPSLWPHGRAWIVLSSGMIATLSEDEVRAVVAHEYAHIVRGDFWINWLATVLRDAFFYLPFSAQLMRLLREDHELATDARVARDSGPLTALALADALLTVWTTTLNQTPVTPRCLGFSPPGLAADQAIALTEQRINQLITLSATTSEARKRNLFQIFRSGSMTGGSILVWLIGLEVIHALMFPFGCVFAGAIG